jgi:hypothetical protein
MAKASENLDSFRSEARSWLETNFPRSLVGRASEYMVVEGEVRIEGDALAWRQALASKGWGTPTWPREYGGGGLSQLEARVLQEEMSSVGAFNPIPLLAGMGVTMVGPTILTCPALRAVKFVGALVIRNPTRARTSRPCRPVPRIRVITGKSTGRRSGLRVPTFLTGAARWCAPIARWRSVMASALSCSP